MIIYNVNTANLIILLSRYYYRKKGIKKEAMPSVTTLRALRRVKKQP